MKILKKILFMVSVLILETLFVCMEAAALAFLGTCLIINN